MDERSLEVRTTNIPARLDRLPWSRFHWLVILALGITWVLDGLEVTIKSAVGSVLQERGVLGLTATQVGTSASLYLVGAVIGALVFGYFTDRLGRRNLFFVTLWVYMAGNLLTALSWNLESFLCFRLITGLGIGGEYAAINSAIDELIPARVRGRVSLAINGSYWLGAAVGVAAESLLLNPRLLPHSIGFRLGFALGPVLSIVLLFFRRDLPESPRWLMAHGRVGEAEAVVSEIERRVETETGVRLEAVKETISIKVGKAIGPLEIARTIVRKYRRRAILGVTLMASQAFFYNGIFFTYAIVLSTFYGVSPSAVPLYLLPFAAGNLMGPLILGPAFDVIGRRRMIALTYAIAGVLLLASGALFAMGRLSAITQTIAWTIIFFIASPAASSAYLTVSEIFPLEGRAMAISLFFAVGTGVGGVLAPYFFGALIETKSRTNLFYGYAIGAALMIVAAIVELLIGVDAEGRSLEDIARPLSASD